jgi:hypothetical protein
LSLVAAGVVGLQAAAAGSVASAPSHTVNDHLMTFTPATVVDPILFGGEPGFTFDPTTPNGGREFVDWPVSSRTNIGVLFRSTDGGLTFTKRYADVTDAAVEAGPACSGRQVPYCPSGGGGDTDTQIDPKNGHIYFSSQESLANEATGVSFDHGVTFPADHVDPVTHKSGGDVDRQWLGYWAGTNTVFLEFHSPIVGSYVLRSDQAGAVGSWYLPGAVPLPVDSPIGRPQIPYVTQSGAMEVDNTGGRHNHAIYVAYLSAIPDVNNLLIETFHVAVSTDGAKTFTSYSIPGGDNPRNFVKLYIDTAGNLYAVWTDSTTNATYLATSKADVGSNVAHPGSLWKGPYRISAAPVRISIFPYLSVSLNAMCMWDAHPCSSPTFHQMRVTQKVNHDADICTAGTTCLATGGNRNLLDYWKLDMDRQGHLGFVWGDTANGIGEPFVKVAREASGPSLYAGGPPAAQPMRGNGYPDAAGDARFPISGANVLHSPNHPTLDLLGTTVVVKGANLQFTIRLASTANLGAGVPTGNDGLTPLRQAKYLLRWDYRGASYYAGANVPAGGAPSYFSGTVSSKEGITSPTNPDNANGFGNTYAALGPATGSVGQNRLVINVPRSAVGNPSVGALLQSVGTYTMVGPPDAAVVLETLPITVDASPTFDTRLSTTAPRPSSVTSGGRAGGATVTGSAPAGSTAVGANGAAASTGGRAVGVKSVRSRPAGLSAPLASGLSAALLLVLVSAGYLVRRARTAKPAPPTG